MYSNNYSGIRIKMKTDPFVSSVIALPYFEDGKAQVRFDPTILETYSLYLIPTIPFIRRVRYSSEPNHLHPQLTDFISINIDGTYDLKGNLNELGLYKRKEWEVQKEVRYSFCLLPHSEDGTLDIDVESGLNKMPFPCCYVALSDDGFNSIEITLGPCIGETDKERANSLMEKHFPFDYKNRIHRSVLKIKKA